MKKFKLFALTALFCAMGTNAFAAFDKESATKLFTFKYDATAGTAVITGFVSELDAEFKSALAIPATVTHPTETEKIDGVDVPKKYFVVEIAKDAFKGQPVNTVSFYAPTTDTKKITAIGAGAFAGTNIQTLDLTNTAITTVENLFGTKIDWVVSTSTDNGVVNNKLTSVTLPATWTTMAEKAFENCTALATISFGTAASDVTLQKLSAGAFAGCPLTTLNFTGSKIKEIPANLLYDNSKFTSNASLLTVTLTDQFKNTTTGFVGFNDSFANCTVLATVANLEKTAIDELKAGEFKGDVALSSINTTKIAKFNNNCFDGCAALETVSFKVATLIGERAFAASGLTSVEFPATGLTAIGTKAFFECGSLEEATLAVGTDKKSAVATIGEQAFAYTIIEEFEIPATTANLVVGKKAFAGTPISSFTWGATAYDGKTTGQQIAYDTFNKCSDVTFNTTEAFISAWETVVAADGTLTTAEKAALKAGPTNATFSTEPPADPSKAFTLNAYSTNPKKFYTKWHNASAKIQVKKSECKVYAGFLEGDNSLGLIQYKADGDGMITIGAKEAVLIVTSNSELKYTPAPTSATSTSWMGTSDSYLSTPGEVLTGNENALKYCDKATTRGTLEGLLKDDSYYIYGWVKAGGFQKITSGTTIPEGTLFAFAKEPVGGRMTIKWYDENGNLEAETTAIESEATAINGVKAAEAEGQRYNVAGQKVNGSYKGLVIKDGKKYMQK